VSDVAYGSLSLSLSLSLYRAAALRHASDDFTHTHTHTYRVIICSLALLTYFIFRLESVISYAFCVVLYVIFSEFLEGSPNITVANKRIEAM
jgi:hypothetical protein